MEFIAVSVSGLVASASASGTAIDWTDLGPFGAAIVIAWFLLNRSDKVVEKEKIEAERDLKRALDSLEAEKIAHEATRRLLYDALHLEPKEKDGDP